jgi:hypothetical protein
MMGSNGGSAGFEPGDGESDNSSQATTSTCPLPEVSDPHRPCFALPATYSEAFRPVGHYLGACGGRCSACSYPSMSGLLTPAVQRTGALDKGANVTDGILRRNRRTAGAPCLKSDLLHKKDLERVEQYGHAGINVLHGMLWCEICDQPISNQNYKVRRHIGTRKHQRNQSHRSAHGL